MSAKTRIVVLHMKKLVFAGVITGLGVLLVIFLGILLGSSHKQSADNEAVETMYVPGVYTSSVMIDGNPFDVQVSVDEDHINWSVLRSMNWQNRLFPASPLRILHIPKTTSIPVVCSSVQYPRHWKRHHPIGDAPHANI